MKPSLLIRFLSSVVLGGTMASIARAELPPVDQQPDLRQANDNANHEGEKASLDARAMQLGLAFAKRGEYYRSVTSFEEVALLSRDPQLVSTARLRVGLAYHRAQQFREAVKSYDEALLDPLVLADVSLQQAVRVRRAAARAELALARHGEAFDTVVAELTPVARMSTTHASSSWFELGAIATIANQPTVARQALSWLESACTRAPLDCDRAKALREALNSSPPSRRSPLLGAGLSMVLPGAGSLYGGHLVDGMYYFGLTGLAASGAYSAYDSNVSLGKQRAVFWGLASLGTLFYVGSVIAGYVSVSRFNHVQRTNHNRKRWQATRRELPLDALLPR